MTARTRSGPWNRGLRILFEERLFRSIEFGGVEDCWLFKGAWRSRFGYGRIWREGRGVQAHIAMYELFVGPIEEGFWLLHSCDQPLCCNPWHLRPGAASENRWDQFEHGALSGHSLPSQTLSGQ